MYGTPSASLEPPDRWALRSPIAAVTLTVIAGVAMFLYGAFLYQANTDCVSFVPGPVKGCASGVVAATLFGVFGLAVIVLGALLYAAPRFHLEFGAAVVVVGVIAPVLSLLLTPAQVAAPVLPMGVVLLFPLLGGARSAAWKPTRVPPVLVPMPTPWWPAPMVVPVSAPCSRCGWTQQTDHAGFCGHCGATLG